MRRQKRKADSIKLNIVQPRSKKRNTAINIKKISFPFDTYQSSSQKEYESTIAEPSIITESPSQYSSCDHIGNFCTSSFSTPETEDIDESSRTHAIRKKRAIESWTEVRPSIVSSFTEVLGFPGNPVTCVFCRGSTASVYCPDCGKTSFFCKTCALNLHKSINILHNPLSWKQTDHTFEPMQRDIKLLADCNCLSTYERKVTCVNEKGFFQVVSVSFCSCKSEAATLISAGLFPATPKNPQLAFTFELLDLFEALLLECQVSAHDFVKCIGVLSDSLIMRVKQCNLYPVIIDSFEEYRHHKYTQRQLRELVPNRLNDGTKCPACPKDGPLFVSIDGNFGLCRKKSAGKSVRPPLHQNTIFLDQASVDEYVSTYGRLESPANKECNQFLASDVLRSKSRYKALDETGVVGVLCRHEFPLMMLSMRHGERLSYIVHTLEKIQESCHQLPEKVLLLYDVACTLQRHLEKKERHDLLDFFELAVPIFHVYGHKVDCQLRYSPRNQHRFGLTDGEAVERLWAYLRRFSRMTKEMRPSHRVDILTDAILHYAHHSATNLCYLLPQRFQKALKCQQESKKELELMMDNAAVTFTTLDIEQWFKKECYPATHQELLGDSSSWEMEYFALLKEYYEARIDLEACSTNSLTTMTQRINRVDCELKVLENIHQIQRWAVNSDMYRDCEKIVREKEKLKICGDIEKCARERWFLLKLKTKFADGQYLASRLSKNITKQSNQLKKLISCFNLLTDSSEKDMTWTEANDLSVSRLPLTTPSVIPKNIRLSAIKVYHLVLRADEEIHSLKREMMSTYNFFLSDWECLSSAFDKIRTESGSKVNNGALHLLQQSRRRCEAILVKSQVAFKDFVDLPELPSSIISTCHNYDIEEIDCPLTDTSELHEDSSDEDDLVCDSLCGQEDILDSLHDSDHDDDNSVLDSFSEYEHDDEDDVLDSVGDFEHGETDNIVGNPIEHERGKNESMADSTLQVPKCPPEIVSPLRVQSASRTNNLQYCQHNMSTSTPQTPTATPSNEDKDSSDSDDEFIPSKEDVMKRILRLEREEFLKEQEPPSLPKFTEEEQHTLSLISRTERSNISQRGFLHMQPDKLQQAIEFAMKPKLPSKPYFITKKKFM